MQTIIDLTLSTRNIRALATWEIGEDMGTTSDHQVIILLWSPLVADLAENEVVTVPNRILTDFVQTNEL